MINPDTAIRHHLFDSTVVDAMAATSPDSLQDGLPMGIMCVDVFSSKHSEFKLCDARSLAKILTEIIKTRIRREAPGSTCPAPRRGPSGGRLRAGRAARCPASAPKRATNPSSHVIRRALSWTLCLASSSRATLEGRRPSARIPQMNAASSGERGMIIVH